MHLKEKKILQKFAAILKKFSAQGAKKVDYGKFNTEHCYMCSGIISYVISVIQQMVNMLYCIILSLFNIYEL